MKQVGILGAGPAGCACAYFLQETCSVTLIDASSPLRTILPTGGGRCNLAHAEYDFRELTKFYPRGEKFLLSVFSRFSTCDTLEFFETLGIKTYTQSDDRIFPISNSSKDVRDTFLNRLKGVKIIREKGLQIKSREKMKLITDKNTWSKYDEPINKALTVCLLDKITGGLWLSNEDDTSIHWAQPNVISLCGKGIIHEPDEWIKTLNNNISKALLLALICNVTGGVSNLYKNRVPDHWARNCLDTLCDRGIIQTPQSWTDFEAEVSKGLTMAIFCKTFYK